MIQKGPEIRTHDFENGQAELKAGAEVVISTKQVLGTVEKFSVSYEGLYDDVEAGSRILIDDGLIELEVLEKVNSEIRTKVLNSGVVKKNKKRRKCAKRKHPASGYYRKGCTGYHIRY
ncbi:hypothetical protein GCM10020331_065420 [Ectobacillus funiculus]